MARTVGVAFGLSVLFTSLCEHWIINSRFYSLSVRTGGFCVWCTHYSHHGTKIKYFWHGNHIIIIIIMNIFTKNLKSFTFSQTGYKLALLDLGHCQFKLYDVIFTLLEVHPYNI